MCTALQPHNGYSRTLLPHFAAIGQHSLEVILQETLWELKFPILPCIAHQC